jgi:predicted GNAT superfamily acetyltransferase
LSNHAEITIRDCGSLEDYRQCVALQSAIWGWNDKELIPERLFVVAHKIEGQVIGAFAPDGRMAAFLLAVPAFRGPMIYLHSHMLGVLPEYRERGLGRRLKLEQRRQALVRGIKLIEWTFDPLETKNAYFNLERLGAIARRYVVDQYGISSSPLHRGLPTDRLIAEWWLESPRVLARAGTQAVPAERMERKIAVPLQGSLPPESLADVQLQLRNQFQEAFVEGLAVVGFEILQNSANYLLATAADSHEFPLNSVQTV